MKNPLMAHVEAKHLKAKPPQFDVGDIVDVHQRIVEGDKERIQIFSGNHGAVEAWRREQAKKRTAERRPDLLKE